MVGCDEEMPLNLALEVDVKVITNDFDVSRDNRWQTGLR
jgi:hypothetical protein